MNTKDTLKVTGLSILASAFFYSNVYAQNFGVINGYTINLRENSNLDSNVIKTVDNGDNIEIIDKENEFFKVKIDGNEGYVSDEFVKLTKADGVITGSNVNVRETPDANGNIVGRLDSDDPIVISGQSGDWFEIEYGSGTAFINKDFVYSEFGNQLEEVNVSDIIKNNSKDDSKNDSTYSNSSDKNNKSLQKQIIDFALKYIGTPYSWANTNLDTGVDCSGFVYSVFNNFGIKLNRSSKDMSKNGSTVSKSDLEEGDLVFFNTDGSGISHVGIYIGNGDFVHSSSVRSQGVMISNLSSGYYANKFVTGSRVI